MMDDAPQPQDWNDISLTPGEEKLEKRLIEKLQVEVPIPSQASGFSRAKAWELANLTRIAYRDYELFSEGKNENYPEGPAEYNLQARSKLYVPKQLDSERVDRYYSDRNANSQPPESAQCFEYEILANFTYLAYTVGVVPKPDVDRFGFIAKRTLDDGTEEIFVVFRGTREPEEWFNNFQFKQVPFLMVSPRETSDIRENEPKISLGFNKMYTDYRPGLFLEPGLLGGRPNAWDRDNDEKRREKSRENYPQEHQLHVKSIKETIEETLRSYKSSDTPIYFTGHSLGGALATIAALHVTKCLFETGPDEKRRFSLYTFASPRTGNGQFARDCSNLLRAYRIANSEDVVPSVPPATFKLSGDEMLPAREGQIEKSLREIWGARRREKEYNKVISSTLIYSARGVLSLFTGGVTASDYEHVGNAIGFTSQLNAISSNHNMNATYCGALDSIV